MAEKQGYEKTIARVTDLANRRKAASAQKPVQLPLWGERVRGLSNALARGAIFTVGGKADPRVYHRRSEIASVQGIKIIYTGEELRQDDLDVFLQICHLARMFPMGNFLDVTGYALLRAIGLGRSSVYYTKLRAHITRLHEATVRVEFDDGRDGFSGHLISAIEWSGQTETGETARWQMTLDPKIIALFGEDGHTLLDWEQRLTLKPLAKWLHTFYFTHRDPTPYPYKVATIHKLCGSKNQDLAKFRYKLKEALDDLVTAGFLSEWKIDPSTDTVTVWRRARAAGLLA